MSADEFSNGLAAIQCDVCYPEDTENSSRGKWGYIDESGKLQIWPKFDYAFKFDENGIAIARKDGNNFFINKSGVKLFDRDFDQVFAFSDKKARVKIGEKLGFIDLNGNEIIPFLYLEASDFINGFATVQLSDGAWGVIDEKGKFIIQPTYDELSVPFVDAVFFKKGNEKGLMKIESQELIFNDFDEYYRDFYSDLTIVSCFRNYEKIVSDVFSEENFPYVPILIKNGVKRIKEKIERDESFRPAGSSSMTFKEKYYSENALQSFKGVGYDRDASLNNKEITVLTTTLKMPAFNQNDVENFRNEIIEKVNSFEPKSEMKETNFDPSKFDSSLFWEFPEFFLGISYKWDLFGGNMEDLLIMELRVEVK